ncbi:MAG: sulfurtransferase TusA family protein [Planctomycetota bacterium]
MIEVDARGLSCPIPVVKTLKAINKNPESEIIVLLNDTVAKENVLRLAKSKGYSVKLEHVNDEFRLILKPIKIA